MPLPPFTALLEDVLRTHFDNDTHAMADAIGLNERHLRRLRSPGGQHRLTVAHCLKLALAARLDPSSVLRLAEHDKAAALIEELYGPPTPSADTQTLLDLWRAVGILLGPQAQRALLAWLRLPGQPRARRAPAAAPPASTTKRPRKR